jgi:hypothetical protein
MEVTAMQPKIADLPIEAVEMIQNLERVIEEKTKQKVALVAYSV